MNPHVNPACRNILEEIWSSWPRADAVPAQCLSHAQGCAACGKELEAFRALCRRGQAPSGAPLAWQEVLPAARWRRLAAATKAALTPKAAPPGWVPALALAAVGMLLFWTSGPLRRPAPEPPPEVLEKLELLEHLDLLENWDEVSLLQADKGGPS